MPSSTNAAGAAGDSALRTWLQKRIRQHFRSGILHNATWMLSGEGLQLAGRLGYFVIVAHALGPAGYGTYVACTALIAAMSPFASLGTGNVMIKYVARNRNVLPAHFGTALLVTVASGSLLTLFALLIRPRVLPASVTAPLLTAVAIAELLGTRMTAICAEAFMALDQAPRYARMLTWSTGLRLIAALVLATTSTHTALRWAYLYAAAGVITTISGVVAVSLLCGRPRFQLNLLAPSVREGFHFATSAASQSVYNDIDKTMLARLSTVESAAIYAVAYRFVDAAMLPIGSVAGATYPEFFRQGMHGVTPAFGFARRILRPSVVYGIAIAVVLFLAAASVPFIMGGTYAEGAVALRYLCLLPVLKSAHAFLSDTLTGADYQWHRSSAQAAVAGFNVLINLWIIPAFGWRGAAWSSLLTDSLLVVLLYMIIRWHLRRERAVFEATSPQPVFAAEER
jgi:O-antigen/teichoic acid export membrane protein